jgi:hypothetical protein
MTNFVAQRTGPTVHLHSSDVGFCGETQWPRRWAMNVEKVTCEKCLANKRVLDQAQEKGS